MKGISVARARYDFSARDRSELSLQEGDTIKILSKKGNNGWWRGEVYGRVGASTNIHMGGGQKMSAQASFNCAARLQVGFFPANYVEEDYSEYC